MYQLRTKDSGVLQSSETIIDLQRLAVNFFKLDHYKIYFNFNLVYSI